MVQYTRMKSVVTALCVLMASAPVFAARVDLPSLPPSPYADTEVSTNVVINKADISYSDLHFAFDGTRTNNFELAFGTDVNTNGVLDAEEVETRFGWRGGQYFIENARTWEMYSSEPASEMQSISVEMHLDIRYAQQLVRRMSISGTNASAFGGILSDKPPAWLWRREWNLMRVTRRGTEPPSDWVCYNAGSHGFSIRLR